MPPEVDLGALLVLAVIVNVAVFTFLAWERRKKGTNG